MSGGPLVVGLAGGTASGKSTLADALGDHLGETCLTLVHDRYYRDLPAVHRADPTGWNFDHPSALDTARLVADLRTLRSGLPVAVPRYDFAAHRRLDTEETVHPRPVILVEGILVFADPALRSAMDLRVWVETPDDIRLLRRIRRDLRKRGRTVDSVLAQYERTVRPMHEAHVAPSRAHAHRVLSGVRPIHELVEEVMRLLVAARSG